MQSSNQDIRWVQRFRNFNKAFAQLKKFIDKRELNELEQQGLIKAFEYTYELSWNMLKDFFEYQGNKNISGSRDAINEAFKRGLVEDGEAWMQMFKDRNQTTHSYNEATANEITGNIFKVYYRLFITLQAKMESLLDTINKPLF